MQPRQWCALVVNDWGQYGLFLARPASPIDECGNAQILSEICENAHAAISAKTCDSPPA